MRNILVGGALSYANGSLHLGYIAGLLPEIEILFEQIKKIIEEEEVKLLKEDM